MKTTTARSHSSALARVAGWSYDRRRLVLLLWVVLLVGGVLGVRPIAGEYASTFSTPGSDSARAQQLLERNFPARAGDSIDMVFEAGAGIGDPAVKSGIERLLGQAGRVGHVASVVSPYSAEGAGQVSPDRTIAYATLQLDVADMDMPGKDAKALIKLAGRAERAGLQVELAGQSIGNAEESGGGSEGLSLLLAAVILLVSFGSVLAMGLPLMIALFGLGVGTGLIALLTNFIDVPRFGPVVAVMIGIGVGIDYVLFIVTRYRSALRDGMEPRPAVVTATTTSGRAVLFAGCTVVISLLGLFAMNLGFLRGLAVAAAMVVLVVMLASVTLLPAMLGFVGRTIDRLRVPLVGRRATGGHGTVSYRWSRVVRRFPWPAAVGTLLVIIALAVPALSLRFGLPDAGNGPAGTTTRQAYDLLAKGFGPGFNGPLVLVAEGGGDLAPVQRRIAATEDVTAVTPPVAGPDGRLRRFVVFPSSKPQSERTDRLVMHLRNDVLPEATRGTGLRVLVTGPTAVNLDSNRYVADRLPLFIGAVIVVSFLLLMVVFRSVVVAVLAAAMNLLSVGAAYGVIALALQGGWFGSVFGIDEAVPVPGFLPMMMFAILFGLSMDYQVFLLSRIREEYDRTGDTAAAVADGLAATARVITAAAAIMVAVFLSFVLGSDVIQKTMGLGLASAVLVDATLVRMVLVPATMELLGRANWWLPRWLDRLLPHLLAESPPADARPAKILAGS